MSVVYWRLCAGCGAATPAIFAMARSVQCVVSTVQAIWKADDLGITEGIAKRGSFDANNPLV